MDAQELIEKVIDDSSWTKSRVCRELGMLPQSMNNRLRKAGSPKVSFVAAVLNVVGYDLVAVPKGSNLPRGSIVVDPAEN